MSNRAVRESTRALELIKLLAPTQTAMTKADLVSYGQSSWGFTYKHTKDDSRITDCVNQFLDELEQSDPARSFLIREAFKIPDQQIFTFGTARWFDLGLPVVRLGHKRAAALMATHLSREVLDCVMPPFPAFFIELPDGLLHTTDDAGKELNLTGVLVHRMNLENSSSLGGGDPITEETWRWRWAALTGTSLTLWQLNRRIEELVGYDVRESQFEGFGLPIDDHDERVSILVGRLICSLCLAFSNPEDFAKRKEPVFKDGKRAVRGSPTYNVHMLETPISFDARPALNAYVRGNRDSPDIRRMVRGHWKPNLGARLGRTVWIHPYARGGDADDPIMQRVYKVNEGEK